MEGTRAEVYDVATRFLRKVKRTGEDNIMASCPFHAAGRVENTPSFTLSLSRGLYYCFSCGEKGNFRTFLRGMGMDWGLIDQYRFLLDALSTENPVAHDPLRPKNIVYDVSPLPLSLLGLFDQCPLDLVKEGFQEETLRYFDVGFNDTNLHITFPLFDLRGNLVGISGRKTYDDGGARYKIYDHEYTQWELPLHHTDKRGILWNAHRLISAVYFARNAPLIVVEGFKAAMWLHQHGYTNVVALLGRSLTAEQQWILEWLGATVYLLLDNNKPGQTGQSEAGRRLSKTLPVMMCAYGDIEKDQPSDLVQAEIDSIICGATEYYLWAIQNPGAAHYKKEQQS